MSDEAHLGSEDYGQLARSLGSAAVHEASGRAGAFPPELKPINPRWHVSGLAFPVTTTPGNNLWIHDAIYEAPTGSLLVVSCGGGYEFGYWGAIMSEAATTVGLAGLVIDGFVRDADDLELIDFPVFARGLCIRGTKKERAPGGSLGERLTIGDVSVSAGDLVVGDRDGVVVVRAEDASNVLRAAAAREHEELEIRERLRGGERTLEIYGFAG